MIIKPGYYNLCHWQQRQQKLPTIGLTVCSANNRKFLAKITGLFPAELIRYYSCPIINKVTVYWIAGPRKGRTEDVASIDLVNFEAYIAEIKKELAELENNETEAVKASV